MRDRGWQSSAVLEICGAGFEERGLRPSFWEAEGLRRNLTWSLPVTWTDCSQPSGAPILQCVKDEIKGHAWPGLQMPGLRLQGYPGNNGGVAPGDSSEVEVILLLPAEKCTVPSPCISTEAVSAVELTALSCYTAGTGCIRVSDEASLQRHRVSFKDFKEHQYTKAPISHLSCYPGVLIGC